MNRLMEDFSTQMMEDDRFEQAVDSICEGETDPYTACDDLILSRKIGDL